MVGVRIFAVTAVAGAGILGRTVVCVSPSADWGRCERRGLGGPPKRWRIFHGIGRPDRWRRLRLQEDGLADERILDRV
jgi:hypothetical protein